MLWLCLVLQAVVLNLCLAGEPELLLGIENLVCEVQLVLDAFDQLIQVLSLSAFYLLIRIIAVKRV
jgi:hypothetical protein